MATCFALPYLMKLVSKPVGSKAKRCCPSKKSSALSLSVKKTVHFWSNSYNCGIHTDLLSSSSSFFFSVFFFKQLEVVASSSRASLLFIPRGSWWLWNSWKTDWKHCLSWQDWQARLQSWNLSNPAALFSNKSSLLKGNDFLFKFYCPCWTSFFNDIKENEFRIHAFNRPLKHLIGRMETPTTTGTENSLFIL